MSHRGKPNRVIMFEMYLKSRNEADRFHCIKGVLLTVYRFKRDADVSQRPPRFKVSQLSLKIRVHLYTAEKHCY